MERRFSVAFLPTLADPAAVAGSDVVVTDVLRATTTIVSALAHGAERVIPTPEIAAGLQWKQKLGPESRLGGERKGVIIPGYDHGNSPREFTPASIGGRTLVLCTTNGTVAMESARGAARILIGAFVNLSALAARLREAPGITVICSGTDRRITREDVLFAGALAAKLGWTSDSAGLDDSARLALAAWQEAAATISSGQTTLNQLLRESAGGKNLVQLGYDEDIRFCAGIDQLPLVPGLDPEKWEIRLLDGPSASRPD